MTQFGIDNSRLKVEIILKISVNNDDSSCVILWTQNVLMPPNQNLMIPLDQNVLIVFVSNMYNGIIRIFWHQKPCMKNLWIFVDIDKFFVWFFVPNCADIPNLHYLCSIINFLYYFQIGIKCLLSKSNININLTISLEIRLI